METLNPFQRTISETKLDFRTGIPTVDAATAWAELADAMTDPSFELTIEEFSDALELFRKAQRAGAKFDPAFIALMLVLERQMIDTSADADMDGHDHDLDLDGGGMVNSYPGGTNDDYLSVAIERETASGDDDLRFAPRTELARVSFDGGKTFQHPDERRAK